MEVFIRGLNEGGLNNFKRLIDEAIRDFREMPIFVCAVGDDCTGKSSLVATLLGTTASRLDALWDESYGGYIGGEFRRLVFLECPRVPSNDPEKATQLDKADAVVICSCSRFKELDFNVAKFTVKHGLTLYYVRTKLDHDVDNERRDRGANFDEDNLLMTIRRDAQSYLTRAQAHDAKVFALSTLARHKERWDFPLFYSQLRDEPPSKNVNGWIEKLSDATVRYIMTLFQELAASLPNQIDTRLAVETNGDKCQSLIQLAENTSSRYGIDERELRPGCDPRPVISAELQQSSESANSYNMKEKAIAVGISFSLPLLGYLMFSTSSFVLLGAFIPGGLVAFVVMKFMATQRRKRMAIIAKGRITTAFLRFNEDLRDFAMIILDKVKKATN